MQKTSSGTRRYPKARQGGDAERRLHEGNCNGRMNGNRTMMPHHLIFGELGPLATLQIKTYSKSLGNVKVAKASFPEAVFEAQVISCCNTGLDHHALR